MNLERNIEIYRNIKGKKRTGVQLADEYGITKQRVSDIVKRMDRAIDKIEKSYSEEYYYKSLNNVVYKNIAEWLNKQKMNMKTFSELCGYSARSGSMVGRFLRGESPGNIHVIKKILEVTGMDFETAFWTEDE